MSDPLGLIHGDDPVFRRLLGNGNASSGPPTRESGKLGIIPTTRPFKGFEAERATYAHLKPILLAQAAGQFVAVVGDDYAGPAETFDDAERLGYIQFGVGPLYIKQVLADDLVVKISRTIDTKQSCNLSRSQQIILVILSLNFTLASGKCCRIAFKEAVNTRLPHLC